mgnify:CR=1 FL=1
MRRGATSPLNLTSLHYIMLTNAIAPTHSISFWFNVNIWRVQMHQGTALPFHPSNIECKHTMLKCCVAQWQQRRQNGCDNNIWCQQAPRSFHIVWRESNNEEQGTISYAGAWYLHCGHSMATTIGRDNNIYCPWAVLSFHIGVARWRPWCGNNISIPQAPYASITCRSKAMMKNEVLHRRWRWLIIVSCDGNDSNNRAMTTSYVDNELLSPFYFDSRYGDEERYNIMCEYTASHHGDDLSYRVARWRRRQQNHGCDNNIAANEPLICHRAMAMTNNEI